MAMIEPMGQTLDCGKSRGGGRLILAIALWLSETTKTAPIWVNPGRTRQIH